MSLPKFGSSRPEVFCKKGVLRNFLKFTGEHLCQSLFCCRPTTLAQVFSCELLQSFWEHFFLQNTSGSSFLVVFIAYPDPHKGTLKGFQHISCMLQDFVLAQVYLTIQARSIEIGTKRKSCGLKKLWRGRSLALKNVVGVREPQAHYDKS